MIIMWSVLIIVLIVVTINLYSQAEDPVIPDNEELVIAEDTMQIVSDLNKTSRK